MTEIAAASSQRKDDPTGILLACASYFLWGSLVLYWRLLHEVPALQLAIYRVFWAAFFLVGLLAVRRRLWPTLALFRDRRLIGMLAISSVLIAVNWSIYMYCVSSDQLLAASLGYYINPLVSIALGVAFFGDGMSRLRLAAVVLAGGATLVQTIAVGGIPWIAPSLALSFGFYGYFRKLTPVGAIEGLAVETLLLFPLTASFVIWWATPAGGSVFPAPDAFTNLLLILSGPVTAAPLALFGAAARRVRLSTIGFIQYLSPTITLLVAVFLFKEKFTTIDAVTFGGIWIALVMVALDRPRGRAKSSPPPALPE